MPENYQCPTCKEAFKWPAGVTYLEDGTRLLKCPECGNDFPLLPQGEKPKIDPKEIV